MMKKTSSQHVDKKTLSEDDTPFFREIRIEFLVHEMKDPASIIETGARTLLEKKDKYGSLSARQERTLKRILRNAKKTQAMLNDLLEIGRSEAGCFVCCSFSPEKVCFEALIDALETISGSASEHIPGFREEKETIEFLSGNGILLAFATETAGLEMIQDEIKFRQIVGNLIKNAIYHRKERIEIKMGVERDRLIVAVSDDGPGIEPEYHRMIFERYIQMGEQKALSRKGHGIGLAGALICAKSMGGNIEVESEKGNGATFRLTLPIVLEKTA
jgi:two-component system, OmpR family, sensor kinase